MDRTPDPCVETAQKLTAVYQAIASGAMADIPVCNDAVRVEAVGFCDHDGDVLGVVITPWFMNLTLVPGSVAETGKHAGEKESRRFPAGRFDFVHGVLDGFGRVLTCSLYSPMFEFADHDAARLAAEAALAALMDPDNAEDVTKPLKDDRELGAPPMAKEVDRRRFLRGDLRAEQA